MVVGPSDHGLQADIIFVIEGTAINGAYLNDLKSNYVIPTLEYFSQGTIEERDYVAESTSTQYGLVIYQAADCLPNPSSDCYGPYSSPQKLLNVLDKIELVGGKGESHANIAEGLATALQCFEDLQQRREPNLLPQKHCILVCNSPPYLLPVMESATFAGHSVEQLAVLLQERGVNLSILSPRKIPALFKLYEKAGGDLQTSQTKNYAKDPRHLVLLKGYSLKERPISPTPGPIGHPTANISSMPSSSPNQSNGSPMGTMPPCPGGAAGMPQQQTPMMNSQGVQPTVFRPAQTQGLVMPPQQQHPPQGVMHPNPRNTILFSQQPPQTYSSQGILVQNRPPRWPLPIMQPQQQSRQFPNQSALIAQLTQPSMGPTVNPTALAVTGQFNQNNPTPVMGQQQQMHNMSRVSQQPGQGGSMNLPSMVGPGPGQQQVPGQQAQPPPPVPQPNQSGAPSGQQPQNIGSQQTVAAPQQGTPPGAQPSAPQQQPGQQTAVGSQQRQTLWQGVVEWIEKGKNPNDSQKLTRHVPCQVSANPRDGEPDLKADSWPQKLIMQLMPKQLIGNIGGAYLKNSKSVLFHPQNCEALEALTKVMSSGFAGCVHFTSMSPSQACDIKVLILLYTSEKRAYLGFIPNDQAAFVDRLRKVIQHQKTTQALIRQQGGQANAGALPAPSAGLSMTPQQQQQQQLSGSMGAPGGGPQPGQQQTNPQQGPQGGIMMSQTNPMTMGGGQITQNVVTSAAQQMQQQVVSLGQQGAGGAGGANNQASPAQLSGLQNAERHLGGPGGNQQQPGAGGPIRGGQGMMPGAPQRPPFDNIEAARQQNLAKIQHLRQTLEAAQQQELQYKSQLEIISHMKIQQLQQNLEMAQQQEMQFKAQMEQEQQKQLRVQLQQLTQQQQQQQRQMAPQGMQPSQPPQQQQPNQQQRMVRPVLANNPGLRHLLQQQPQYRQQVLNMQQLGSLRGQQQNPGGQPQQQQQFDDVSSFDFLT